MCNWIVEASNSSETLCIHMTISIVMGVPQKRWMVYVMDNPTKMDNDWMYPYFRHPPYVHMTLAWV